jgi:hypothetical protein
VFRVYRELRVQQAHKALLELKALEVYKDSRE